MPDGSFQLVFTGDPDLDKASEIFQIVQEDAAWQAALDLCYERNLLPRPSWRLQRRMHCFQADGLLEIMDQIVGGNSIIKCDFDLLPCTGVEELLKAHQGWTEKEWETNWVDKRDEDIDPGPYLNWEEIRLEPILPSYPALYDFA